MNLAQKNLAAALELFKNGENWIKGHYKDEVDGRICYCSVGALSEARDAYWAAEALDAYYNALGALELAMMQDVIDFNDDPDTTFPQIKAAFEKAIELAGQVQE